MNKLLAVAGNSGPDVRSDCQVEIEIKNSGGLDIFIQSKIMSLYGDSILKLCSEILDYFGVKNASIKLNDSGALPYVICARVEAALAQIKPSEKQFLPLLAGECKLHSKKERHRITRLYLPGNIPKLFINAGIHNPDAVILDLEDSVAPEKKTEARYLVRNALRQVNFFNCERMVRINQLPMGLDDLPFIVPGNVHVILLPKCESNKQIKELENAINSIRMKEKIENPVWIMPIIETALGVEKAFEIASASESIVAMAIGLEDYTADLGVQRTLDGQESFFARSRIVNACKAAGIQAIDSVFSDVNDPSALTETCRKSRALGFEGMGCIHPRQIHEIKLGFSPSPEEVSKAVRIVQAYNNAKEQGRGVVALGTKMIDLPVVKRAIKTLELAKELDLLNNDFSNLIQE